MKDRQTNTFWNRFWRDKNGDVVIYQRPNLLLIIWVVITVVSLFVPRGSTQEIFWWISMAVLGFWALMEVLKGVNYFRKLLGLIVLLFVIAGIFGIGR